MRIEKSKINDKRIVRHETQASALDDGKCRIAHEALIINSMEAMMMAPAETLLVVTYVHAFPIRVQLFEKPVIPQGGK